VTSDVREISIYARNNHGPYKGKIVKGGEREGERGSMKVRGKGKAKGK
jgi:hypothetical protein